MYNRDYVQVENFQDKIARLYPQEEYLPGLPEDIQKEIESGKRKFNSRTITFQVTDACNLRCTYCVTGDTNILMSDGTTKPISEIIVGDKIKTFPEYDSLELQESTVEQTYTREVDSYIKMTLSTGDILCITENHKIKRACYPDPYPTNEYMEAGRLSVGLTVCAYIDGRISYAKITAMETITEKTTVYNIGTDLHTYVANNFALHNCYQIAKKQHFMTFDIAKKFADMMLESSIKNNDYIDVETSPGVVFEFIGGEPFLAIDLISEISDYLINRMIEMNHPWRDKFMFSICSNGVLYMDERVQKYIRKHAKYLSFSISIDGNKKLHDACRIFPDGSGSYDIAIAGVKHFKEHYNGHMGSKMTMAPGNISYIYDAVCNLISLGYTEIFLNCVYEEGWTTEHASIMYGQMKQLSDFIIDNNYFSDHYLSFFDDSMFRPMDPADNQNWCGGTGAMISCDYKGDIYPCIRYMESSLGDSVEPLKIGNVYDGIMKDEKTIECVKCLRDITRESQSEEKCFNCPIASGCSWCSAYNYQCFGTANKRATFICIMHKSRALSNLYYWNKGFRKYAPWFRMGSWIPKEWALEIISEDEYQMLLNLASFNENDVKLIQNMIDNNEVPVEYMNYAREAVQTGQPVYTNNISAEGMEVIDDTTINSRFGKIFDDISKYDIDALSRTNGDHNHDVHN